MVCFYAYSFFTCLSSYAHSKTDILISTQVLLALYAVNCIYNSICVCLQLKSHWTIRVGLSCMSHKTLVSISVQQNLQRNVSCLKN